MMSDTVNKQHSVGIDYHGTISLNIEMWKVILSAFRQFGYKIYVISYRVDPLSSSFTGPNYDISYMDWVKEYCDRIIFAGFKNKKDACADLGILIDIWIDDVPSSVLFNHSYCHFVHKSMEAIHQAVVSEPIHTFP